MPKQSETINLLQAHEKNMLENFLYWSLTIGRFVVIFTETIAIIAFLYRFTLDAKIIDLHTDIKRKEAIVQYQKADEDTYRDVQSRLAISSQLIQANDNFVSNASDIINTGGDLVKVNVINLNEKKITIDANVQSVASLGNYIQALRNNKNIQVVSLDNIDNKTSQGLININVSAILK